MKQQWQVLSGINYYHGEVVGTYDTFAKANQLLQEVFENMEGYTTHNPEWNVHMDGFKLDTGVWYIIQELKHD